MTAHERAEALFPRVLRPATGEMVTRPPTVAEVAVAISEATAAAMERAMACTDGVDYREEHFRANRTPDELRDVILGLATHLATAREATAARETRMVAVGQQEGELASVEYRDSDNRFYAYKADGTFLWSGSIAFTISAALRGHEAAAQVTALTAENERLKKRDDNSWAVKYQNLLAAVQTHHKQKADDRCIEDDTRLYYAAGLTGADHRVGDKFEMLKNCAAFIDNRCKGGGWPTYRELEARAEAAEQALRLMEQCMTAIYADSDAYKAALNRYDAKCEWYLREKCGTEGRALSDHVRTLLAGTPAAPTETTMSELTHGIFDTREPRDSRATPPIQPDSDRQAEDRSTSQLAPAECGKAGTNIPPAATPDPNRCQGCGLMEMHKMCPAYGTDAYMMPMHPAWGSVWGIINLIINLRSAASPSPVSPDPNRGRVVRDAWQQAFPGYELMPPWEKCGQYIRPRYNAIFDAVAASLTTKETP